MLTNAAINMPTPLVREALLLNFLLGSLDECRTLTKRYIQEMPIELLRWRFQNNYGWNCIGFLVEHVIANENLFRIWYLERRHLTQKEKKDFGPGHFLSRYTDAIVVTSSQSYLERLDETRNETLTHLHKIKSDKTLLEGIWKESPGSNIAYGINHLMQDENHHRGQMKIYKKMFEFLQVAQEVHLTFNN
jgi:hypothetical protein